MNKFEAENADFDKAARVQQAHFMFLPAVFEVKKEVLKTGITAEMGQKETALMLGLKKIPEKKPSVFAIIKNIFN